MNGLERPTPTVHRIDVSAYHPRSSAAPVTERDLFRGYAVTPPAARVRRVEPCACGVSIIQISGEKVADVVARHNESPEHLAWRYRRWRKGVA